MKKIKISSILTYLFLVLGAIIMVFPFFWMITGSFKTSQEVSVFPPQWLPKSLYFGNYKFAFETAPFAKYFLNSVIVVVSSVSVCTFTTILGAFAFSRLRFPGRSAIFGALLAMMMVPFEMLIITNYRTVVQWNIHDTLWAMIPEELLRYGAGQPLSGSPGGRMFGLEISVARDGADRQAFPGDDHPAERHRQLEQLPLADAGDQLRDCPYTAVRSV